ncbi:hypothetical protein H2201_008274 [Coniosporium apollinis]|uniref:Transposase Tc1-like domain-containing protein n=1 Tax=Coniosporium apollinis TaxID=61459 RepID=A0ABQ9NGL6_9PEZI|nr:hypothetical protein H2201_008274 [Coniosporium apollinis]
MGRKVKEDATSTIVSLLEKNTPIVEIGRVTNVSETTIYRMRLNLELFGNPYTPQTVIRGRPKLLTVAQEDALIEWIKSQPTTPHLDEMAAWLDQQFGTKASLATVYRTLERAGFSKKDAVKRKRRTAADRGQSSSRRLAHQLAHQLGRKPAHQLTHNLFLHP